MSPILSVFIFPLFVSIDPSVDLVGGTMEPPLLLTPWTLLAKPGAFDDDIALFQIVM